MIDAESSELGPVLSGLKKAWDIIDNSIAWLCGEDASTEDLQRRQAQFKTKLSIKTSPGNREEDYAAQQLLLAGGHSEIMPLCVTPTCGGLD